MRIGATLAFLAAVVVLASACDRSELFRQFEYEEEIYLALDGTATVYVNTSVAALDALRGASFDTSDAATIDRTAVRQWFTSPVTRVTRTPSLSRRSGRRFVHVRLDVDKLEQLPQAPPFAWSAYHFAREGDVYVYHQTVGAPAGKVVGEVGWKGDEMVAFRLHLPSTILSNNTGAAKPRRGNILVWEQPLAARLRGVPLTFDATMESQSILSRTLLLFGATFGVAAMAFGLVLWWISRHGRHPGHT